MKKHIIFASIFFIVVCCFFIFSSPVVFAQQCDCECANGTQEGVQPNSAACLSICQQANMGGTCTPLPSGQTGGVGTPAPETPKAQLQNPLGSVVTIPQIVSKIIKLIMGLVGIISLVMFIYAGFLWLTAQGKPDAVKKGRDTMLWAVVGLVVIFSSYIILNYIFKVLTF